ncbi:MAG TPA: flagellar filament outer layer protein FlaA [Spirochaetota bacterium]|nr:hypothetical protein [Spirochaetota bacterium]HOD15655.1 flagellar filament outer layer protein FlaA [Spirochaetota bacterium]HPG50747.1 flagellar filament outer layer protein FlaA [Spirochaetota bacterium]HPN12608.1 flagellar filament outer layer protein FlaA [Spirochaetota bacterium]
MFKKLLMVVAALALATPLYTQEKGIEKQDKKPASTMVVLQEVMLEDFETTPFSNKDITYSVSSDQEAGLSIRNESPATANSKKYLGIKVKTRGSDTFVIKPPKEIILENYCKSISLWVYGEKTYGEISLMLQDADQVSHRLVVVPVINFLGWKQFTVLLTNKINQGNAFQNKKKTIKIMSIQYRTTVSTGKPSQWEYIYLDDLMATVKEHGGSKQNDQW